MFLPCRPCCEQGCGVADGKPRTDPETEGTWVPSGTWDGGGVTWTFVPNTSGTGGETWFFFGSIATSKPGGNATPAERQDWGNICNWYSNKTTTPSSGASITTVLNKRATRLPPTDAIVHIYSPVSTNLTGPVTVKNAYFWGVREIVAFTSTSELTASSPAHDSDAGSVYYASSPYRARNNGTINGGAHFIRLGENSGSAAVANGGATFRSICLNTDGATVNDGASFFSSSRNESLVNGGAVFNSGINDVLGVVNGGAVFNAGSGNVGGTVNGGATFNDSSQNAGGVATVNGGATFNDASRNYAGAVVNGHGTFNGTSLNTGSAVVNDGATFNDSTTNTTDAIVNGGAVFNGNSISTNRAIVYDGAVFNGSSRNYSDSTVNGGATFNDSAANFAFATVNGGATFNDFSSNNGYATVNGGATFNNASVNGSPGTVNGGATFNDAACSIRTVGVFANCPGLGKRIFVAHPTDLPICNGTAPDGCNNASDTCGCG
tara:strand:- start:320 stop:1795 length:1476 start_codon:yes stop_codon:yes gene_type:complete